MKVLTLGPEPDFRAFKDFIDGDFPELTFFAAAKEDEAWGDLVNEDAFLYVLRKGKTAGAAMDTFLQEPLPQDHPFWGMDNVIITPDVGGTCDIYVEQTAGIFRENLKRFLMGEKKELIN